MKTPILLATAAALIIGHAAQAASLESTSANGPQQVVSQFKEPTDGATGRMCSSATLGAAVYLARVPCKSRRNCSGPKKLPVHACKTN